ncbi:basic salivary proline-rich protein 3-like [Dipodomys merriami]|uniref:basic salivary proline-rich protein 3-like n=1 Tax=Dipodomys merriami TaxID=94247 RepID=UPI00384DD742
MNEKKLLEEKMLRKLSPARKCPLTGLKFRVQLLIGPSHLREEATSRRARDEPRLGRRSRRERGGRGPQTRRPLGSTSGSPRAPPGGGAGAWSRRSAAEGQQQLRRSAAGEGGTEGPGPRGPPGPGTGSGPQPRPPPAACRPPHGGPARAPEKREGVSRRAVPASILGDAPAPPPRPPPRPGRPGGGRSPQAAQAGTAPAEPPAAACVSAPRERSQQRLMRAAKAPSSAESGSGSSQHPGPRTRNYFPTRSPRPPPFSPTPSLSPPPPATSLRHRPGVDGVTAASTCAGGIPPRGQVVPRDLRFWG